MSFQDAKDTFYLALRDRLAALNPDRTMVVRGATRIGVMVEENELPDPRELPTGAFVLRWSGFDVDASEALPLSRGTCEIRYATAGMPELAGMDRGRTLQAMDEELCSILQPASVPLRGWSGVSAQTPVAGETRVFWSDAVFGEVTKHAARIERVATVEVFAWKEDL